MSLTTLNQPLPGGDLAGPLLSPRLVRLWHRVSHAAWRVVWWAWLGLHLSSIGLARLITWFADDPRRVRTAAGGAVVCAALGAVVGVGLGWLLTGVVTLLIDVVWAAQG